MNATMWMNQNNFVHIVKIRVHLWMWIAACASGWHRKYYKYRSMRFLPVLHWIFPYFPWKWIMILLKRGLLIFVCWVFNRFSYTNIIDQLWHSLRSLKSAIFKRNFNKKSFLLMLTTKMPLLMLLTVQWILTFSL